MAVEPDDVDGGFGPTGEKPLDALGGIQFQVPNGGHWDYRPGHNNAGKGFEALPHPKFDPAQWSQVEMLVDAGTGTARLAVAQPVGGKAVEGVYFTNHYSPEDQRPEVQKFIADYKAKYGGKTPDAMAVLGYDAMQMMADAIFPALLFLAFWYGQAALVFLFFAIETRGRSIEEINRTLDAPAGDGTELARAPAQ